MVPTHMKTNMRDPCDIYKFVMASISFDKARVSRGRYN